jgi:hypothetical protein
MQISPYVVERNTNVTNAAARGEAYDVRDTDGKRIGMLSAGDLGWRILSAGWGVPFDQYTFHAQAQGALDALVATVAEQTDDGVLTVDESGLTRHQRDVLDFMGTYAFANPAKRDAVIWQQFDMTPTRFMQQFNALLNHPKAAAYAPMIVNRHRRLRDDRAAKRSAKRLQPTGRA